MKFSQHRNHFIEKLQIVLPWHLAIQKKMNKKFPTTMLSLLLILFHLLHGIINFWCFKNCNLCSKLMTFYAIKSLHVMNVSTMYHKVWITQHHMISWYVWYVWIKCDNNSNKYISMCTHSFHFNDIKGDPQKKSKKLAVGWREGEEKSLRCVKA